MQGNDPSLSLTGWLNSNMLMHPIRKVGRHVSEAKGGSTRVGLANRFHKLRITGVMLTGLSRLTVFASAGDSRTSFEQVLQIATADKIGFIRGLHGVPKRRDAAWISFFTFLPVNFDLHYSEPQVRHVIDAWGRGWGGGEANRGGRAGFARWCHAAFVAALGNGQVNLMTDSS